MRHLVLSVVAVLLTACSSGTQFDISIDAYKQPCVLGGELSTCYRIKTEYERDFRVSTTTLEDFDYTWGVVTIATVHIPKAFGTNTAKDVYAIDAFVQHDVPANAVFDLIARIDDNTDTQQAFTVTGPTEGHLADGKAFTCQSAELCTQLSDYMKLTAGTLVVHAGFSAANPTQDPILLTGLEEPQ